MTFSTRIKSLRDKLSLTQAETAAILGISKSTLEKWEAGSKVPLALTQEGALTRLRKVGARGKRKEK